jgi:hypothetical protein
VYPAGLLASTGRDSLGRTGLPVVVTTTGARFSPLELTTTEVMVVCGWLGIGAAARAAGDDHTRRRMIVTELRNRLGDPEPAPEPAPEPDPEPDPEPEPESKSGTVLIPATVDGVPTFLTPDDIRGERTDDERRVRLTVTVPGRDDSELPDIHHPLLPDVLRIIAAAETVPHLRNVWLAGPAGTGKSTMPEQAAETLGLDCRSISCGPDDSTAKWFGFIDATGTYHGTAFRSAFEHGGVFIIDEIDAADSGILTCLNQALAANWYEFPDGKVAKHSSLRIVATANTWGNGATREYVGRQEIDAATMDRFGAKLSVDYDPDLDRMAVMTYATTPDLRVTLTRWLNYSLAIRAKAQANRIKVIVSPRGLGAGAGMISAGFTPEQALNRTYFAGINDDTKATLTPEGLTL